MGAAAGTNKTGNGVSESNFFFAAIHNIGKPAAHHVLLTALWSVDCPAFGRKCSGVTRSPSILSIPNPGTHVPVQTETAPCWAWPQMMTGTWPSCPCHAPGFGKLSLNEPAALNVLNVSVQRLSCAEIHTERGPEESLRPSPAPLRCWASQGSCLGGTERTNSRIFQGTRT